MYGTCMYWIHDDTLEKTSVKYIRKTNCIAHAQKHTVQSTAIFTHTLLRTLKMLRSISIAICIDINIHVYLQYINVYTTFIS